MNLIREEREKPCSRRLDSAKIDNRCRALAGSFGKLFKFAKLRAKLDSMYRRRWLDVIYVD